MFLLNFVPHHNKRSLSYCRILSPCHDFDCNKRHKGIKQCEEWVLISCFKCGHLIGEAARLKSSKVTWPGAASPGSSASRIAPCRNWTLQVELQGRSSRIRREKNSVGSNVPHRFYMWIPTDPVSLSRRGHFLGELFAHGARVTRWPTCRC